MGSFGPDAPRNRRLPVHTRIGRRIAMKRALITGITGQDGRHLSEHLLEQGYEVFGVLRGQHNPKRAIVEREVPDVRLVEGDLTDQVSLISAIRSTQPDEV